MPTLIAFYIAIPGSYLVLIDLCHKRILTVAIWPQYLSASKANQMLHHKANLNGYLSYHIGQSLEKTNQDTDRDFVTSVKEAKEYGLIDEST